MAESFNNYYVRARVRVKLTSKPKGLEESPVLDTLDETLVEKNDFVLFQKPKSGVSGSPNPDPPIPPSPEPGPSKGQVADGTFYLGTRLKTTLYADKKLRNSLGLYLKEDLTADDRKLSVKLIRNANDGLSLGFFNSVYATFVATDSTTTYGNWGPRHRTYIVFDRAISYEDLGNLLYNYDFKIGPSKAGYKIELDSLRIRNSRKAAISI